MAWAEEGEYDGKKRVAKWTIDIRRSAIPAGAGVMERSRHV
jgi:hypothetical protein